jgi:hypothetical protein
MRFIHTLLLSLILATSLSGCEKAQQESTDAGKQAAEALKINTIDAAKEAAALAEKTAKDTAEAAEQASAELTKVL